MTAPVIPQAAEDPAAKMQRQAREAIAAGADAYKVHVDLHHDLAADAIRRGGDPVKVNQDLRANLASLNAQNVPDGDAEPSDPAFNYWQRVATNLTNLATGFPGAKAAAAGIRSVVRGQPYTEAVNDIDSATGKIPALPRLLERGAGGIAASRFLPKGAVAGGAAFGAAQGALDATPQSAGDRVLGTATGAASGAVAGRVAQALGNVAGKKGLTDFVASKLRKVPGSLSDLGQAIGTRGALNDALATRQSILDQLTGSEKSAAQTMIDHIDNYKAQAKGLYDSAKQDVTAIEHPKVNAALKDPTFQQMLTVVRQKLGTEPTEVVTSPAIPAVRGQPRLLGSGAPTPAPTPVPSDMPTNTREAIKLFEARQAAAASRTAGTVEQQTARAALERRAAEASLPDAPSAPVQGHLQEPVTARAAVPAQTVELPTPEEVAGVKRLAQAVVSQKFGAPTGIDPMQAARMAPLLNDLRSGLHESSPAWKQADDFYSRAKNFEDTFQSAYGARATPTAAGLKPFKLRTPEALDAFVAKADGTPTGIARASGQQGGAAARIAESVKAKPIDQALAAPELAASSNAAKGRTSARFDPALLSRLRDRSATDAAAIARPGVRAVNPLTYLNRSPKLDYLNTPAGRKAVADAAERLNAPGGTQAVREQVAAALRGKQVAGKTGRISMAALVAAMRGH